ncbi:DUF695 domain-containing protein [Rufibacter glacialis]|uniref:DUF695 domain-containing protein n=1 Tax=Rufibacter glacialis TaxID=1259555 RepID=A0A5M8Q9F0_9BACT|nr:DUF695 domain-containing protein [Rufibacter glacialis]KAA6431711.1 DUF695 domain-containing protein [Rufibacter glacialis]GGK82228.1 hypothetical protein GCM10011405_32480 [Rufibacter glacialis]
METKDYQPDWEVYFCQIESKPAFIGLDLNLATLAPLEEQNQVIEITVPLASVREDGFPEDIEWEALGDIEDALVTAFENGLEAIMAGKTLNAGLRKFYFYASEVLLVEHHLKEVEEAFPQYQFAAETWEDPEWETYLGFLFPEPADLQRIQNGKVLRNLEDLGDNPDVSRKVVHWIYFRDEASLEKYWQEIAAKGYRKEEEGFEPHSEETPFKLQVSLEAKTQEETIHDMVLYLWNLAQEQDATYDGWETSIEKGDPA